MAETIDFMQYTDNYIVKKPLNLLVRATQKTNVLHRIIYEIMYIQ